VRRTVGCHMLRPVGKPQRLLHTVVILRHRIIRALSRHPVSPRARKHRLGQRLLEAAVAHVRRVELRAAMVRTRAAIRIRSLHLGNAIGGDKCLTLGIEGLPVITAWNRVLALGVIGIGISRQLPISIRDSARVRAGPGLWIWALVEGLLLQRLLLQRWLHRLLHGLLHRLRHLLSHWLRYRLLNRLLDWLLLPCRLGHPIWCLGQV